MTDKVDEAIAGVEHAAEVESVLATLEQFPVVISGTGRPMVIAVPPDMSLAEVMELVGWVATNLAATMWQRELARKRGGLILPGRLEA